MDQRSWGKTMTLVHSLEIGFLSGIALFFILQRLGVIDKWFEALER